MESAEFGVFGVRVGFRLYRVEGLGFIGFRSFFGV